MDERIKQSNNELEENSDVPEKHSLGGAVGTLVTMGLVDVLAHLGPTGLVIGGIASYVVWKHGPEVYEHLGSQLPLPDMPHLKRKSGGRSFWDRALGRYPQVVEAQVDERRTSEAEDNDLIFTRGWHRAYHGRADRRPHRTQ